MFAFAPVSTKVMRQSSMSRLSRSTLRPPWESTKSFDTHSSYFRKKFLIALPP